MYRRQYAQGQYRLVHYLGIVVWIYHRRVSEKVNDHQFYVLCNFEEYNVYDAIVRSGDCGKYASIINLAIALKLFLK